MTLLAVAITKDRPVYRTRWAVIFVCGTMSSMDATELSAYSVQHNPWHAAMNNTATAQTMAVGGFVQATMDTVEFDPSSMVTLGAAAGKFTIQQDGLYFVCGAITVAGPADTVRFAVSIFRNGGEMARGVDYSQGAAASVTTASCWATRYMVKGDTIDIRGQNFITNQAVHTGASFIYLSICYVGVG